MAISKVNNLYWDINADPTSGGNNSVELGDVAAFIQTIHNLFRTKVGDRGATGRPDWGNHMYLMLQEPICDFTAFQMKTYLLEDIRKGQPLAVLDLGNTTIVPVTAGRFPGYRVTVAIQSTPLIANPFSFTFTAIPS